MTQGERLHTGKIVQEGTTVPVVEHDMDFVRRFAQLNETVREVYLGRPRDARRRRRGAGMTAGGPILSVEDLEVSYGPTQVIFGVSLDVPEGGLCCLMGRNVRRQEHPAADDRRPAAGAARLDLARRRADHEGSAV